MSSNFVSIQPIRIEEGVPVFQPTWLEFRDFFTFLQSIENYGTFVGLLKIIPPKEWTDLLMVARQKAAPIENTSKENDTLLSSDSFNEKGSAQLHGKASVQSPEKRPLSVSGGNYDHTGNLEEMIQRYGRTSKVTRPIQQSFSGENGLFRQLNMEMGRSFNLKDFKKFADSQLHLTASNLMKKKIKIVSEENSNGNIKTTSVSKNSNSTSTEDAVLGLGGYTREKLLALEKLYWKTLPYNEAYYGADLSGSLFPSDFPHWNMQKLPCLLRELGILLPGVNSPYLYFGAWKATFAWHVEDMDLFSINYLHFGAPKQWYSISCSNDGENMASSSDRHKFESAMRSLFPADYKRCRAFLRHKTFVASPDFLQKKHHLRVNRVTQFAGEIMITFPYGYHQGFNYGFNCAEAVNFALPSWVEKGQLADHCACVPDSVRIKMPSLIKNVLENFKNYTIHPDYYIKWLKLLPLEELDPLNICMKMGPSLSTIGCCVCMKNSGGAILKKVKDCLIERQYIMKQLTVKECESSFNVEDILNSNLTEVAQMIGAVVHPQCLDSFSLGTFLSEDVQSSSVRTNLFPQSSTIPQYTSCSLCHSKDVHLPLNYTAVDHQGGERTCERGISTSNPAYRMLLWTGKCKVVNCHKRMHLGCFLKHEFMLKIDNIPEREGTSESISVPDRKLFVLCETHHPRKILERKLKYQYCKLRKSLEVLQSQMIFNHACKSSNDQMGVISHSPLQSQLNQTDAMRVDFKEKFLDSGEPLACKAINDSGSEEQVKNSYELIQGTLTDGVNFTTSLIDT